MSGLLMAPTEGQINTFLSGGRLLIMANISLEDIDKLQKALEKYREILTLCQDNSQAVEAVEPQQ